MAGFFDASGVWKGHIPSNIISRRFKPHVWLSGCVLAFGIVVLAQGFVKNYSGLLVTRFLLGPAEAGIFPGSFYILSCWYKRDEALEPSAFYPSSVIVSNMFGGLLATTTSRWMVTVVIMLGDGSSSSTALRLS